MFELFADAKQAVSDLIPLNRDWYHLAAGAAIVALCFLIPSLRRRNLSAVAALGITLALGVALEVFDVVNALTGKIEWQRPMEFITDILWTSLVAIVSLAALALRDRWPGRRG